MKNILLSIIVPVYNVEDYLNQCIDSLINLECDFYEIVLIDDGSTDRSGLICDEYCRRYSFIRVVHKFNEGLGYARNTGIQNANGDYVLFIDSDDFWTDSKFLFKIRDIIDETYPELIVYKNNFFDNNRKIFVNNLKNYSRTNSSSFFIKKGYYGLSAWNKVVRKDFLISHRIFFEKGVSEDLTWNCKILANNPKIKFILDKDIYVYRLKRAGSITQQKKELYFHDWCEILDQISRINVDLRNENFWRFASFVYFCLFLEFGKKIKEYENSNIICVLKRNLKLLKYSNNFEMFIIKCLIKFFGIKITLRLIYFFKIKGD